MLFLKKDSKHINHLRGGHLQALWGESENSTNCSKLGQCLHSCCWQGDSSLSPVWWPGPCRWTLWWQFLCSLAECDGHCWMRWATDNLSGCLKCTCQPMPVVVLLPSANIQTKYVKCKPGHIHTGCKKHLVSSVPVLHKAVNTGDLSWWHGQTLMLWLGSCSRASRHTASVTHFCCSAETAFGQPTTWPLPLLDYHTRYISYFASSRDYINAIL